MPEYERSLVLPSRGLPYGADLPDGQLSLRSMTTQEEKLLASNRSSTGIQLMESLFRRCVKFPEGFTAARLLTVDRYSLFLQLRVASYGPEYQVEYNCHRCGRRNKSNLDLEKDILSQEEPLSPDDPLKYMVLLPVSGVELVWRHTTGEDEIALDRQQQSKKISNDAELNEYRVARQILSRDGQEEKDFLATLNFVRTLPVRDALAIRDSQQRQGFGASNLTFDFTCSHCGAEQPTMPLPVSGDFFRMVSPAGK